MEAKKCHFAALSCFVLEAILVNLQFKKIPESICGYIWDPNIILAMFQASWSSDKRFEVGSFAISPNLTMCHQSAESSVFVNCCPLEPEIDDSVIVVDFQFPDPRLPLRVRRRAHRVGGNYVAKYNKALSVMKSLPYNAPRSFARQAYLHCLFCTGAYNQQHADLPLDIHKSWLFFPWHRMMLHFHERILRSLIGDDAFALPFWTWDIPEGMVIPEMYMNSTLFHEERDFSHFPPRVLI